MSQYTTELVVMSMIVAAIFGMLWIMLADQRRDRRRARK